MKEPQVVPWYRDIGTGNSDSSVPPACVAALGSQLSSQRTQRLQFPVPIKKGTVPEALTLRKTPYDLASPDAITHRQRFCHCVPTRHGSVVFFWLIWFSKHNGLGTPALFSWNAGLLVIFLKGFSFFLFILGCQLWASEWNAWRWAAMFNHANMHLKIQVET